MGKRMAQRKKYYAVSRGLSPGIYDSWSGPGGAEEQIRGFSGALYRGFASLAEAQQWLKNPLPASAAPSPVGSTGPAAAIREALQDGITVYTDGGCLGNPGPGGYGVVLIEGTRRTEMAGGYRWTTNNRMELMACIEALKAVPAGAVVTLYSDSRYVVNGINRGWARRWRANHWMRTPSEAAENSDLWAGLLELCDARNVRFVWVHGHSGQRENERCDALAKAAAEGPDLLEDLAYTRGDRRIGGHVP